MCLTAGPELSWRDFQMLATYCQHTCGVTMGSLGGSRVQCTWKPCLTCSSTHAVSMSSAASVLSVPKCPDL